MIVFKYKVSQKVYGRYSSNNDKWSICIVLNCFTDDDDDGDTKPAYEIQDIITRKVFGTWEDTSHIREYKEKPWDHIKQSIEYGDDGSDIENLITINKIDINLVYKDVLEESLYHGNASVIKYLKTIKNMFDYHELINNKFGKEGRSLMHVAALKNHNLLLSFLCDHRLCNSFPDSIFNELDYKKKSMMHYLVAANNIDCITHFMDLDLITRYDMYKYEDNNRSKRKVSIIEWEDAFGKTPIQYALCLKRDEIYKLLSEGLVQNNISFFIDDVIKIIKKVGLHGDISFESIECVHKKYYNVKDGVFVPCNIDRVQKLLFDAASKGLLEVLQYFHDFFPHFFHKCSNYLIDPPKRYKHGFYYHHGKILSKFENLPRNLLSVVILGDISNNIHTYLCDLSIYQDDYFDLIIDNDDGFDYFKQSFDLVFEAFNTKWMMDKITKFVEFFTNMSTKYDFGYDANSAISNIIEHIHDNIYTELRHYYLNGFRKLRNKHAILKDIYVFCKLTRIEGIRVQERKETLKYLQEYYQQTIPLHLFIDFGQEYLLFDWFDFNLPVDEEDLKCLNANKKVFLKSKLELNQLTNLTKGQFMIFYAILVDEIGSLMSLVQNNRISNKYFSFGPYPNILYFR
jgi:hypothetical protein